MIRIIVLVIEALPASKIARSTSPKSSQPPIKFSISTVSSSSKPQSYSEEEKASHGLGAREHGAVNSIHDRRSADHPPAEIPPVEALDGVLAALDAVELEVDVALRVRI
jgi:hypothetical protein